MMTNLELAKWSLSSEEWEMLKKYYDHYRIIYKNGSMDTDDTHRAKNEETKETKARQTYV